MYRKCMGCMNDYDDVYDICPYCGYEVNTFTNENYHLTPSTIIQGRYIVGKVVGYGGFGVTYIGWDALLETKVAIKEYFPNEFATRVNGDEKLTVYTGEKYEQFYAGLNKFIDESRCLAKLVDIEGIVKIKDCFESNNTAYIVMEYLEGYTLKEILGTDQKLSVNAAVDMIKPILVALERIHAEGIIHRDIAPDNIFVTSDGGVKLIDFGASRFATTRHSKSLSVVLKQGYSPEEQYRSRGDQGPWTDVYSTAATLYKMITGITPDDSMERSVSDKLKEPSKLGIKISKSLENSIMNALNVGIEGRTKTARQFLDELEAEEVKRVKEKKRKFDIGKWPIGVKVGVSVAMTALLVFGILMATGVIHFNYKKLPPNYLEEGYTRIPNVINKTEIEAEKSCKDWDIVFQIYDKTYSDDLVKGVVMGQQLYGGSIVETGSTLLVMTSAGARQTIVPDVVGYMEDEASEKINAAMLAVDYEHNNYVDSNVKPSAVLEQSLEAGTAVSENSLVALTVSVGRGYDSSEDTTVPKLVGKNFDNALLEVEKKELYIYKAGEAYSNTVPRGKIISQEPSANKKAKKGDVVEVIISKGSESEMEILVPDVEYKLLKTAKKQLEDLGFVVKTEYVESDIVVANHIVKQSIPANSFAKMGSEIVLSVSKGNELAQVNEEEVDVNTFVDQEQQAQHDILILGIDTTSTTENVANNDGITTERNTESKSEEVTTEVVVEKTTEEVTTEMIADKTTEEVTTETFADKTTEEVTTETIADKTTEKTTTEKSTTEKTTTEKTTTEVTTEIAYDPVEHVKLVSVPDFVGKSESEINSLLDSLKLSGNIVYKHDENVPDRQGLSQSIAKDSQVSEGTMINIVVCNNDKKTQYRERSKRQETTTSKESSLAGWTRYDSSTSTQTTGWGSWSTTSIGGSRVSGNYTYTEESKTQYSYRDKSTTTGVGKTMSGYTLASSTPVGYTDWSADKTTTTKPTTGDLLKITKTTYNYFHYDNTYKDGSKGIDSVNSGGSISKNNAKHTYSTTTQLPKYSGQDIGNKQMYGGKGRTGEHACSYNWYVWFLKDIIYTYQTREEKYSFYKWSDWSSWSDTPVSSSSTKEVKTQTVYRHKIETKVTTYYYKRDIFGNWSDWDDNVRYQTNDNEVETQEVYIY